MLPLDISLTISETIYTVFGRVLERLKGRNIGTKRRSVVGRILDRVPRPHVGLNHWSGGRGRKGWRLRFDLCWTRVRYRLDPG